MTPDSIVAWNLASVSLQGFLYGLFFVLFCASSYLLAYRDDLQSIAGSINLLRRPLFMAGIGFFLTVTGHWAMVFWRSFQGFMYFQSGANPALFYVELANASNLAKTAIMLIALLLGDAVLVYRVYVVWSHNRWVTIVPLTSFLGSITCCVGTLTKLPTFPPGGNLSQFDPYILANVIITVVTNCTSCFLIGYKMWSVRAPQQGMRVGQDIWWVLGMFIENAFIYVLITLTYLVVYEMDLAAQFLIQDTLAPLVGITFMMINVRVGLGYKLASDQPASTSFKRNSFVLRPLAVTITQVIDTDVENDVAVGSIASDKAQAVETHGRKPDVIELSMKSACHST